MQKATYIRKTLDIIKLAGVAKMIEQLPEFDGLLSCMWIRSNALMNKINIALNRVQKKCSKDTVKYNFTKPWLRTARK